MTVLLSMALVGCADPIYWVEQPCGPVTIVGERNEDESPFEEPVATTLRRTLDLDVSIVWHEPGNPFPTDWQHITEVDQTIAVRPEAAYRCGEPAIVAREQGRLEGQGSYESSSRVSWENPDAAPVIWIQVHTNEPTTKAWMLETLGIPDDRYAIGLDLTDDAARLTIGNVDGDIAREEPAFLGDVTYAPLGDP
ncbi:MAG: hypothetical protein H6736_08895 [Alphaproteobacteria bacterium]|nr:hypothetical protein [Alphaproteobacteria bacterium]